MVQIVAFLLPTLITWCQVFEVVFRGFEDPAYHPDRLPRLSDTGNYVRDSYLIHAEAERQAKEAVEAQRSTVSAVMPVALKEQKATVKQIYPKSPRPSGIVDPEVAADFRRTREVMRAQKQKDMKPFIRPDYP